MEKDQSPTSSNKLRWRYIFAVLSSFAFAIVYGLNVNVSVTMIAMVNHTALKEAVLEHDDQQSEHNNHTGVKDICNSDHTREINTGVQDGPFVWNEHVQGVIFSAYFWGYITSQIPGGLLADAYSAKNVLGVAIVLNGLLTIITPVAAKLSYIAFIIVRILQGIIAGTTSPAMHALLPPWIPPQESSQMSAVVYSGVSLGTVITLPLSGVIALYLGWEWVFYILGCASLLWCVFWFWFVTDYPDDHKYMSEEEKKYISSSTGPADYSHRPVPWKQVMTSVPFHAIWFTHLCSNTGWYMLLTQLPTYLHQIHNFGLSNDAILSASPYLSMWLFSFLLSNRLDWARSKGYISVTGSQKISICISSVPPALCLIGVTLAGCDRITVVALMVVAVTCMAGIFPGYVANLIRIAPHYAGTLMGLSNTIATVPGFVVPYVVGQLTHKNQTLSAWNVVFYGTALIYVLEAIVYMLFSSGEMQSWNDHQPRPMTEATVK